MNVFQIMSFVILVSFPLTEILSESNQIQTNLTVNPFGISGEKDKHAVTLTVFNSGSSNLTSVELGTAVNLFNGGKCQINMDPIFAGDPNGNDILEPGEFWVFSALESFDEHAINNYTIAAGVSADSGGETVYSSASDYLILDPVNMDVRINSDVTDTTHVELVARLLIDEDVVQDPGTTTIVVAGTVIEIQLPKSRWELRDLIITADGLNNGQPFNPFDPPIGVELETFCDQGADGGRNINFVLDEQDTINTVRMPCDSFGQDDPHCEFPDWVFCYTLTGDNIPNTICASDSSSIWKSDEEPAGSGLFKPFENISETVETVGNDCEEVDFLSLISNEVKLVEEIIVYPNPSSGIINFKSDLIDQEVKIQLISLDGKLTFEEQGRLNNRLDLDNLAEGEYILLIYDLKGNQLGREKIGIIR